MKVLTSIAFTEQIMYSASVIAMKILTKPTPNEDYFKLSAREAGIVAMKVAKDVGGGATDWEVFRDWQRAWKQRNRTRNLSWI